MIDFVDSGFAAAPQIELSNGSKNKLLQHDRPVHDWYRFVLSYPPHLVRKYIEEFGLGSDDTLLDPFCGTGTTVVEAKLCKVPSIGLEANRFAKFAGAVKLNWGIDPDDLLDAARGISDRVLTALNKRGISDVPEKHIVVPESLRTFTPEQEAIVLRGSMSPIPLHKTLVLLYEINRFRKTTFGDHIRLAIANVIVFKASNLRFGPEVGIGRARHDVPVVSEWLEEVERIAGDIEKIAGEDYPDAKVLLSDARDLSKQLGGSAISGVITSPPYPNEKDYTRTTRLESVLLGFVKDKADLRTMKKTLLRSNTRGVYKEDDDDKFILAVPEIGRIAEQIEERRIELKKNSGFEKMYGRVTKLYFGGMARHLKELSNFLIPGAQLAYVVGDQASYLRVMIRTGTLLGKIAETLGYELVKIDQFRTRFSTATKSDLNEEVVVLRWRGKRN